MTHEPLDTVSPLPDSGYDVMIFPANRKFIGLTESDIPAFIRVLQGEPTGNLKWVSLEKSVWLVCGHDSRDGWCGGEQWNFSPVTWDSIVSPEI